MGSCGGRQRGRGGEGRREIGRQYFHRRPFGMEKKERGTRRRRRARKEEEEDDEEEGGNPLRRGKKERGARRRRTRKEKDEEEKEKKGGDGGNEVEGNELHPHLRDPSCPASVR